MSSRLTQREWQAISEALGFRLADEIEEPEVPVEAYLSAQQKVWERIEKASH